MKVGAMLAVTGRRRLWKVLVVGLLSALVAGCDFAADGDAGTGEPAYVISDIQWLPDGHLYMLRYRDSDSPFELAMADGPGQPARPVLLTEPADCPNPELLALSQLPDGQLGAVQQCSARDDANWWSVVIDAGRVRKLGEVKAYSQVHYATSTSDGWLEYKHDDCAGIARIINGRLSRFPAYQPRELVPWQVDGDYFGPVDCTERGLAGMPRAIGAGALLFVAAPGARGKPLGPDRGKQPSQLLRLDLRTRQLQKVLDGVDEAFDLVLAADGGEAVLTAMIRGKRGAWLVNTRNGATKVLKEGDYQEATLSPDGAKVAVVSGQVGGDRIVTIPLRHA